MFVFLQNVFHRYWLCFLGKVYLILINLRRFFIDLRFRIRNKIDSFCNRLNFIFCLRLLQKLFTFTFKSFNSNTFTTWIVDNFRGPFNEYFHLTLTLILKYIIRFDIFTLINRLMKNLTINNILYFIIVSRFFFILAGWTWDVCDFWCVKKGKFWWLKRMYYWLSVKGLLICTSTFT